VPAQQRAADRRPPWDSGLLIVDKPGGMTSHDVVARVRRLAHTRRVGHAGTLDPMATGVLVIGIEKATRLLGHLMLTEKTYEATIRLGLSTSTDDAEGEPAGGSPAGDVTREALQGEIAKLTGEILQVPSSVSAIKVNGQRAYKLTRAGEAPELAARPVTIHEFRVTAIRQQGDFLDIDAVIRCSSGTYIRALARDLGAALGTGGHLTALRRTAVGTYTLAQARTLKELEDVDQIQSPERVRLTPDEHAPLQAPGHAFARPAPGSRVTPPGADGAGDGPGPSLGAAPATKSIPAAGAVPDAAAILTGPTALGPGGDAAGPVVVPLADAAAAAFPRLDLTVGEARRLAQGARLPLPGGSSPPSASPAGYVALPSASIEANGTSKPTGEETPIAAFAPDGTLVALVVTEAGQLRSLAVFADASAMAPDL
jgi:tRNA pseudouridine55 synthase